MATTAAPYGLLPVGLTGSRSFAGGLRQIKIASTYGTSIFYGDPVKVVANGVIEKDTGTDAMTPIGVFLGCSYTDSDMGFIQRQYWPASTVATDAMAYVCDDPDIVMQVQADGQVAQTALGANFALVQTAGTTTVGKSKVALGASTANTTNTLPVRLVGFVDGPFSTINDSYTDCLVRWNVGHAYRNTTGI